jgi:hypothetical protein
LLPLATTTIWFPAAWCGSVQAEATTTRLPEPPERDEWQSGAVLPGHRWRPLTPSMLGPAAFRTDRDVALLAPDPDATRRPPDAHLARLGTVSRYLGVARDTPGKTTLTVGDDGRRLGLHLDNWDRLPAADRHTSRNRVNLNLGPEARWFMFADVDVAAAHRPKAVPNTDSTRELVHRSPEPTTVVRLLIPAGWAYIAPTENRLHDASSTDQRNGTRHASALGWFSPERQLFQNRVR